jgi:hypothetical protein
MRILRPKGDFYRLGVLGGQECLCEGRNVAAIMLTTSCNVSGDHPLLTLLTKLLFQWVSLPLHVGWETALLTGKCPMFTQSPWTWVVSQASPKISLTIFTTSALDYYSISRIG